MGLVDREILGLAAANPGLGTEGLLGLKPWQVSRQTLLQRLMQLPVRYFAKICGQVLEHLRHKPVPPSRLQGWSSLPEQFLAIWMADGSTLQELRNQINRGPPNLGSILPTIENQALI